MSGFLLIIAISNPGHGSHYISGNFPNMASCLEALKGAEIRIPDHNNENEWAGFKVCLPEDGARASYKNLLSESLKK